MKRSKYANSKATDREILDWAISKRPFQLVRAWKVDWNETPRFVRGLNSHFKGCQRNVLKDLLWEITDHYYGTINDGKLKPVAQTCSQVTAGYPASDQYTWFILALFSGLSVRTLKISSKGWQKVYREINSSSEGYPEIIGMRTKHAGCKKDIPGLFVLSGQTPREWSARLHLRIALHLTP